MSSPTGFIPYDTQTVKYVTSIPSNPDSSIVYMLWDGVDASKAARYEFSYGKLQSDGVAETTLANLGSASAASISDKRIVTNCNFSTNVTSCLVECILDGTTNKWKTEINTSDAAPTTPSFPVDWIVDWIQG